MRKLLLFFLALPCFAGFQHSLPVTVNGAIVSTVNHTSLTNFPMVWQGTLNTAHVLDPNGCDIRVSLNAAGTTFLDAEVVSYNNSTGATTIWISQPSLSYNTNTPFYILYGNQSLVGQPCEKSPNVWAQYAQVNHFEGSNFLLDSSPYLNHALNTGSVTQVTGQVGSGVLIGSTTPATTIPYSTNGYPSGNASHTISAWFSINPATWGTPTSGDYYSAHAFGDPGDGVPGCSAIQFYVNTAGTGPINAGWTPCNGGSATPYASITANAMHFISATYNGTQAQLYIDGVASGAADTTSLAIINSFAGLANNAPGSCPGCTVDEARVANFAESADWIATEYANQSNPSTFYTVGSETSPTGGGGGSGYIDCNGNYPQVSLSQTSLSYGTQLVNQDPAWHDNRTPPQIIMVQNNGAAPLTFAGIALTGTNPGDWWIFANSCIGAIAPGGYCQVQVSFNPFTNGATSATLKITANDAASPYSVNLTGAGTVGTIYYISPNGSDSGNGSISQPWALPNLHRGNISACASFVFRGGHYVFDLTQGSTSGTPPTQACPFVFKSYPGERAFIDSGFPNIGDGTVIWPQYPAIFQGITFQRPQFGFTTEIYSNNSYLVFESDSWLDVGSSAAKINTSYQSSTKWPEYLLWQGNYYDGNGNPGAFGGTGGSADEITLAGLHHSLFQNNSSTRNGHYYLENFGGGGGTPTMFQRVRDEVQDQYWDGIYTMNNGAFPSYGGGNLGGIYENNLGEHFGWGCAFTKVFLEAQSGGVMWRKNIIANSAGWAQGNMIGPYAQSNGVTSGYDVYHQRGYNNTFYNPGNLSYTIGQRVYSGTVIYDMVDLKIGNEIIYSKGTNGAVFSSSGVSGYNTNYIQISDNGNRWGTFFGPNWLFGSIISGASTPTTTDMIGYYNPAGAPFNGNYTLSQAQGEVVGQIYANIYGNPNFVSPGSATNPGGFALQGGSIGIGTGAHLAFTTAAGSGNIVPISDVYWFDDGQQVVEGQKVRIGRNGPAKILRVDLTSGTITVAPPVTFLAGDSVDPWYIGIAPDRGAMPYSPTAPTINSSITTTYVNATQATITWTTTGPATTGCRWGITTGYSLSSLRNDNLTTSHSCTITGAWPGQTYHAAVVSVDANGGRTQSSDFTFTMPVHPGPTISNVRVSGVSVSGSTTNVTISWTTPTASTSGVSWSDPTNTPNYSFSNVLGSNWNHGASTSYSNVTWPPANSANCSGGCAFSGMQDSGGVTSHSVTLASIPLNTMVRFIVQSTDVSTGATNYSPENEFVTPAASGSGPVFSGFSISAENYATDEIPSTTCYGSSVSSLGVDPNGSWQQGHAPTGLCGYSQSDATVSWTSTQSLTSGIAMFITESVVGQTLHSTDACYGNTPISSCSSTAGYFYPLSFWEEGSLDANSMRMTTSANPPPTTTPSLKMYRQPVCANEYFYVTGTSASGTGNSYVMEFVQPCLETPSNLLPYPPQTYMTETATSITTSGATITWTSDQAAMGYVEYGTTSAYGSVTSTDSNGTSHSRAITGLTTGTTYHYAVVQTNSSGQTFTGPDQTFTTH